jgi:hypothetical protein
MSSTIDLSAELQRLSAEFGPLAESGGQLSGSFVRALRTRLLLFARLARNQEEELAVHRLMETERAIAVEIEQIAAAARDRLARFRDDNVVDFADFHGGKDR